MERVLFLLGGLGVGNITPSSDQAHAWYTNTHVNKTLITKKYKKNLKINKSKEFSKKRA